MADEKPVESRPARRVNKGGRPRKPIPESMSHLRPGSARAILKLPERYQKFASGELSLDEMDMEELERGQLRDLNGAFTGVPPASLPIAFYKAMRDELIRRVEQQNMHLVGKAFGALQEVMTKPGMTGDARVKAATQLLDRLVGPVGTKIEMSGVVKQQWEVLLEGGGVAVDLDWEKPAEIESTIDAEIVED